MASGTSDQTVVPNQEGAGMKPSLLVASSKSLEIIQVEAHQSKGMEPSFQATSFQIGSTSSPKMKVNPFMKDLPEMENDKKALTERYSELKKKLDDRLQKEALLAFLEDDNIMEAQEKVEELFNLFEGIELVIKSGEKMGEKKEIPKMGEKKEMVMERWLRRTQIPRKDSDQQNFKKYISRFDIYHHLFLHTLTCARFKFGECLTIIDPNYSDSMIIRFMAFLINKVKEEDTKDPSLTFQKMYQEVWTKVTSYVHLYEEVTISAFICLVVNGKGKEAKDLFERLLQFMKPSDIINRGRVYNYALQKAEELHEVHKFCTRYEYLVQLNDRLNQFTMEDDQDKVCKFVEKLYLNDLILRQERKTIWEFIEKYDYPYLMKCVWANRVRIIGTNNVEQYNWTPLQLNYVFTSSAAMTSGGKDIMEPLLEAWPKLVNAPYKGVAALHVAASKQNKEVIKFLLGKDELDINECTGRLITGDDVKDYLNNGRKPSTRTQKYATVRTDREEMIKDILHQSRIEVNRDCLPVALNKFDQNKMAGKKWNKNGWDLPTFQTALHIATTKRHAKVVQLLGDAPEKRRLRCHEEDEDNRTPLDILYEGPKEVEEDSAFSRIKKVLLSKQDVQNGIDRLYRDRQVLVDAVNTILVGAALIASVTYAGWLQPPLGYAQDYSVAEPYPAPPDTYDSYLAVQGNLGVKVFALFNTLSFFFAITTVIVGADAAFPQPEKKYIKYTIQYMQPLLRRAIHLFFTSLVCVLGAFGSAAIVVLPPSLFFRKDLVLSILIGGSVCGFAMWQFLSRHSKKVEGLNNFIVDHVAHINKFANVF